MFRPEWLQSRRVAIYVLAYLSDGKEPKHDTRMIDDPELSWHRNLKIAVDTGELRFSGELGRHPDPEKQGEAHGFTLIDFDDLAEYAKTVSFDRTRLTNVLRLWKAVLDGAPQDDLEEIFDASRTEPDLQPKETGVEVKIELGRPSLKDEIETAYRHLADAGKINFDRPKTETYEPIRQGVRKALGVTTTNEVAGLGDETIRQVIATLFDRDKAARPPSNKLSN